MKSSSSSSSSSSCLIIMMVVIAMLFMSAHAVEQHVNNQQQSPQLPRKFQPLRMTNILLDVSHTVQGDSALQTSGFSEIHTLSQNVQSYFSTTSLSEDDPQLYPFGKNMYFSFQTQTAESFKALQDNDDDNNDALLSSVNLHEFSLTIDDSPIYTDKNRSTTYSPLTGQSDNDDSDDNNNHQKLYSKHTSFKGTRMNEQGQTETLFITITPTGGDYLQSNPGDDKTKLETQSVFTPQSGRVSNQYTIEGYLVSGDKQYHIASFSTLQYQVQHELTTAKAQAQIALEQFDEQSLLLMTAQMDTMSTILDSLAQQRNEASYDLAIVELDLDRLPGDCGTKHDHGDDDEQHPHDHHINTKNDIQDAVLDPLAVSPSYFLSRWSASCNPYIGRLVIFPIRIFASYSYQVHASASTTIVPSYVEARTKLLLQIINQVTQEQLGFIWKLADTVSGSNSSLPPWNALGVSDSKCQLENSTALNGVGNERLKPSYQDVAVLHGLVTCSSSGVVGIASVAVLCSKANANGVSSINFIGSWTTFAHELQHQVGMVHPFRVNSDAGKFGGLADYYNIRLPKTDRNPSRYGFNEATDSSNTCAGLRSAILGSSGSLIPSSQCFTMNSRSVINDYCGNGIVEPWEECDATNACCTGCKLAAGATCGSGNPECCVNCSAQGPKRCSMPGDTSVKTGLCSTGGICVLSNCAEAVPSWAGDSCPDNAFFPPSQVQKCGYICPTSSSCSSASYSTRTNFETGATCTKDGVSGICVDTEPFNVNQGSVTTTATCVTNIEYVWKYTVVSQCDCANSLGLIDVYTCINTAGSVVSSSFCEGIEKPARDECCCSPPCAQDSESRGGSSASTVATLFALLTAIFTLFAF